MAERVVEIDYCPRGQFVEFHERTERWACLVCHRRAGKTVACINDLIRACVTCDKPNGRFAYCAPTYVQAKDVAWQYLKQFTAPIPGIVWRESELAVEFPNGARLKLYGADNYDRLRGLYLDGVVLDEYADMDPRAWPEVIRPALSDRQGWAVFIGTPKGRNAFYKLYETARKDPVWYTLRLRASETGLIPAAELDDAKGMLTAEQYAQEYETDFSAAIKGAYYGREMALAETEGRIGRVPHDRAADVYCSWDLGIGDNTALWVFQIVGREWHWIRYYANAGQALDHYVDWVKALPFTVHEHILPHDAKARELQSGKTRVEFLESRGINCSVVPRHADDERIDAARIRFNRFWFDEAGCEAGLESLRMYHAEFDEKAQVLRLKPRHDWASHGADAFGYGVMGANETPHYGELPQIGAEFQLS